MLFFHIIIFFRRGLSIQTFLRSIQRYLFKCYLCDARMWRKYFVFYQRPSTCVWYSETMLLLTLDTFPRINYNDFCQHNRAQRENIKVIILWEYFECTNEQQYTRIRFYPFERKKTSKYSLYNGKRKRISLCDRKNWKKTAILVIWVMNTQCVDTNWKTKECTLNAWEIEKGYWEWDFTMQQ